MQKLAKQKTSPRDGLLSSSVEQGNISFRPATTKLPNITSSSKPATPQPSLQGSDEMMEQTNEQIAENSKEKAAKYKKDVVKMEKKENKSSLELNRKQALPKRDDEWTTKTGRNDSEVKFSL